MWTALPDVKQMMAALRRRETVCASDHPVLFAATELVPLHQRLLTHVENADLGQIAGNRASVIRAIDAWVYHEVPMNHHARLHTETIGEVIDRLALRSALIGAPDAPHYSYHFGDLRIQLDELAVGYQHLTEDVTCGRRRLPKPSLPLGVVTLVA